MSQYTAAQRNGEPWAQPLPQFKPAPARFHVNQYRDSATGRDRWAVLETSTRVWYFPTRYGMRAAQSLARRLRRQCSG
jgi:hypothetical protein